MRASGNLYDAKKTNNYVVIKYILPFLKNNMIIRKNTPLYWGAEACLLRPESTPMCSAVHSGRGSRAFYGQKARRCKSRINDMYIKNKCGFQGLPNSSESTLIKYCYNSN